MVDTTDIEKKSLEAHVELCAERYRMLELKVETVEKKSQKSNTWSQKCMALCAKWAKNAMTN
jgi:hypothetical protein